MDWIEFAKIAAGVLAGGGGVWGILIARENKRKTPYDMLLQMLDEQKKFYQERNADYEREKLDSAEKSSVIMQSHFCKHKYTDPQIVCPVDVANDERLKKRCDRCGYNEDKDHEDRDHQEVAEGELHHRPNIRR